LYERQWGDAGNGQSVTSLDRIDEAAQQSLREECRAPEGVRGGVLREKVKEEGQGRMYTKDSRRNIEGGGDVCKLLEEGVKMAILKHCRFSYK
jgi:hypothetical protein